MNRKQFEKKKFITQTVYDLYKKNPDKTYTIREIGKILAEQGATKNQINYLYPLHSLWKFKGILLHKRPEYIINPKSKAKPNWTDPRKKWNKKPKIRPDWEKEEK